MVNIRGHHNRIVDRLANAVRSGEVRLDRQVPDSPDQFRPDIVITNGNEITIIDITYPFESNADALAEAEVSKTQKYEHLQRHFED